jgi:hypothetical protein
MRMRYLFFLWAMVLLFSCESEQPGNEPENLKPDRIQLSSLQIEQIDDALISGSVVIFRPESGIDWQVGSEKDYIFLRPGIYPIDDAVKLEKLSRAEKPLSIIYYDPDAEDALKINPEKPVILQGGNVKNCSGIIFHGIYFRGGMLRVIESSDITLNECEFSDFEGPAVRAWDVDRFTAQDCLCANRIKSDKDSGCFVIEAIRNKQSEDCRIVGNVILNAGDGIGLPWGTVKKEYLQTGNPDYMHKHDRVGELPGLLIAWNVIQTTEEYYTNDGTTACGEDAIDIKNRGTKEKPIVVRNNIMGGQRRADQSCGGTGGGTIMTIHENAAFVEIRDNVFEDANVGMTVWSGKHEDLELNYVSDIVIRDNAFRDFKNFFGPEYANAQGRAIRVSNKFFKDDNFRGIIIEGNEFSKCQEGYFDPREKELLKLFPNNSYN